MNIKIEVKRRENEMIKNGVEEREVVSLIGEKKRELGERGG